MANGKFENGNWSKATTMPITKTAKRALRSSNTKKEVNRIVKTRLEVALRLAKKQSSEKNVLKAISLLDRTARKKVIHKNKAARLKSGLAKLLTIKRAQTTKKSKVPSRSRKKQSIPKK